MKKSGIYVAIVALFLMLASFVSAATCASGGASANVGVNQGQGQSTVIGSGSGANQQNVNFQNGEPTQLPVVPYQAGYPQLPYLLHPAQQGDNLVAVLDFLVCQQEFTLGQLVSIYQSYEDNGDVMINGKKFDVSKASAVPSSNKILIVYKHNPLIRQAMPLTGKGVGNRKNENKLVDSHKVLAALGIQALIQGNNVLKVGSQGGNTVQLNKAFGLGIGGSGGGVLSGGLTLASPISASLVKGQANIVGQPYISASACVIPDYQMAKLTKENRAAIQRDAVQANIISGPEPEVKGSGKATPVSGAPSPGALVPTMK
jgi:hypothetical protein